MAVKVSVIIPVFNEETYLKQCLDSVLTQTLEDIEVLCVDDGSTDASWETLTEFCAKDLRLKIFRQQQLGAGIARNRAIELARGEYVIFLDADDCYYSSDALEALYAAAKKNNAKVVGGEQTFEPPSNRKVKASWTPRRASEGGQFVEYRDCQISHGYQPFIFSRKMLIDNGLFFPPYLRYQDPPFFAKALFTAGRFFMIPKVVHSYRVGHKKINWSFKKVNDLVKGLTENIVFSLENSLEELNSTTVDLFDSDYFGIICDSIFEGNNELLEHLLKADSCIKHKKPISESSIYNLRVLNYCHTGSKKNLSKSLERMETLIFYGAGIRGEIMLAQAQKAMERQPDLIWDENAGNIKSIQGHSVFVPDYASLSDGCLLVVCIEDAAIFESVKHISAGYGFSNIYDWSELQRVWMDRAIGTQRGAV